MQTIFEQVKKYDNKELRSLLIELDLLSKENNRQRSQALQKMFGNEDFWVKYFEVKTIIENEAIKRFINDT
jgi:hypothetical protein